MIITEAVIDTKAVDDWLTAFPPLAQGVFRFIVVTCRARAAIRNLCCDFTGHQARRYRVFRASKTSFQCTLRRIPRNVLSSLALYTIYASSAACHSTNVAVAITWVERQKESKALFTTQEIIITKLCIGAQRTRLSMHKLQLYSNHTRKKCGFNLSNSYSKFTMQLSQA